MAGHANSYSMVDDTMPLPSPSTLLYADDCELGDYKRWTPGQPIVLLGCHTGADPVTGENPLAKDLAIKLHTDVSGVDKYFFFDADVPQVMGATEDPSSPTGYTAIPDDPGQFITFHPYF
jgi:hypothetical protein